MSTASSDLHRGFSNWSLASGGWTWGEHVDVAASGGGKRVRLRFRGLHVQKEDRFATWPTPSGPRARFVVLFALADEDEEEGQGLLLAQATCRYYPSVVRLHADGLWVSLDGAEPGAFAATGDGTGRATWMLVPEQGPTCHQQADRIILLLEQYNVTCLTLGRPHADRA